MVARTKNFRDTLPNTDPILHEFLISGRAAGLNAENARSRLRRAAETLQKLEKKPSFETVFEKKILPDLVRWRFQKVKEHVTDPLLGDLLDNCALDNGVPNHPGIASFEPTNEYAVMFISSMSVFDEERSAANLSISGISFYGVMKVALRQDEKQIGGCS